MSTVGHAHPNIALIKYWGKLPGPDNVPAVPSLSITLDTLTTSTEVVEARADQLHLNGLRVDDAKVEGCLENLRRRFAIPPVTVRTDNNFPTAAGLASSASGFAALVTAIDTAFALRLTPAERSVLARQASASAARSIFGGFVTLKGPDWRAAPLIDAAAWPLKVVIAVTDTAGKAVSSSDGMRLSAATSPYYPAWIETAEADFDVALQAIGARDFGRLAEVAEQSCLKMHGLMLSTRPALVYWNAATLACLHRIRALRAGGESVFFTVDAGPQVKAVCLPESRAAVAEALGAIDGVKQVITTGLGTGAWAKAS